MEQYLALKASAGSGKTFALTVRYISLLLLDIPPKEILTLTFTNKAASQMSEKISNTLFDLGDDEAIVSAIIEETKLSKAQILDKKDKIIKSFLSSSLSIYTIDKFINKILREFSGYAGVSDDFSIEYDDEELLLYKFLISLNEKKFDSLIKFSYQENKKLNSIVELFKALDEKNENLTLKELDLSQYEQLKITMMQNANYIKEFVDKSELSNSAKKAVDFDDIKSLLVKGKTWLSKDTLQEYTYFKKATVSPELENYFQQIKQDISNYYNMKEAITLNHLFGIFNDFKSFRDKHNKAKNTLEFRDITNIVYKLLQHHIDKDFLYFRLDSDYSSILIDEFQDTSVLQYKILEPLIEEILSGSEDKFKTFFYVGDTKQSIYRFRGGAKELFDYVANIFKDELKVKFLDTNYRSSKNVVSFVNRNFSDLTNYEYNAQKVNSKVEGLVEVVEFTIEEDEPYKQIFLKVEELLKAGHTANDIAILTYTNADVLNLYLYLKQQFPTIQITTEMTSKLLLEQNIQAIINVIKYLYFQEEIYLANFNTLIGKDFTDELSQIELFGNIKTTNYSLAQIIKEIANKFLLMDNNVIKLIELSSSYHNIVDFIYDIDRLDALRVFKDKQGIQILTIFKSKGLEFETVLVLDRMKRKNSDKSSLLFEYEDIKLKDIYLKNSGRESFDENYQNAITKEQKLSQDDELNILYVALTRAKNNLIVFKKEKNSVFDILGEDCRVQQYGQLHYENNLDEVSKKEIELEYKPLDLGLQEKQVEISDNSKQNIKAKYFGIATHYCLEMMMQFTAQALTKSLNITKNKYSHILNENDFDDIYNRIKMLIVDSKFMNIIEDGEYFTEQALIYNEQIKILDLLIKKDDVYYICDYKTTSAQKDEHQGQVAFYKEAIKGIVKSQKVFAYVVYLQKDDIVVIEV